jgi:hypothetical protein
MDKSMADKLIYIPILNLLNFKNCNLQKGLCMIIGDVNQFIFHCLIPLDLI